MASTHTEIYRPLKAPIERRRFRAWPLFLAAVRAAWKKKFPLLGLYLIPSILLITTAFVIHSKFALQDENMRDRMFEEAGDSGMAANLAATAMAGGTSALINQMLQVHELIARFNFQVRMFALLAVAWFGAGLIAEDRRAKAHLLYFSRPISRMDYFLGRFGTTFLYGSMAMLVPGLSLCGVAAWSSPDWAFVKHESDTIWATLAYGTLWVGVMSLLVLAASSLVTKKSFALAIVFTLLGLGQAFATVLERLYDDASWMLLSVDENFRRVGRELFGTRPGREDRDFNWPVEHSYWVLGGLALVCIIVLHVRLRSLEVQS